MADQNPTGRGDAVALKIPADHLAFLRRTFESARAGVREELRDFPKRLNTQRLQREEAAYTRLLEALEQRATVPDRDALDILSDLAGIIDQTNEYRRVVSEHDALHGLLAQLVEGRAR